MFIAALWQQKKKREHLNAQQENGIWNIHMMEYYIAKKWAKATYVAWIKLQVLMLHKNSVIQFT